jgi:RNA polymerase sigma-70 factor (ECF subfamily)
MRSACSVAWYVADDVPQVQLQDASHGELVRRAAGQARDRDAEAELCRRFAPRARLYGLKHLRDEDRARDLVQAVLVAMIEAVRAGRVEDPERFDRFVLGMCRNLVGRARYTDARAVPTEPASIDVGEYLPDRDRVDLEAMMRCLQQLELRARTVLHLSFYRDKTADEIAVALETTAGNVRVVRHRAIAMLRDCMGAAA